jgi:4-azaleucine resistance transporter AzlC
MARMSRPSPADEAAPTTTARFTRGLRLGIPILLGYLPIGMAFGVLARTAGFTIAQAVACSALALAGAGQFIALALMRAGADAGTVLVATGVVNLRYVLLGATLTPYLRHERMGTQTVIAATLTDETFGVNVNDLRGGSASPASMNGVGAISWVGWVGGTLIGAAAAGAIGDPTTWGLDFAMAAMFSALLVATAEDERHWIVAGVAATLAIGFSLILPGKWPLVAAAIGAAAFGAVVYR